ncbi:MAG: hypothetical protein BWX84_02814 [Verrucomicrobia bacterium ADurb.Bin118]|jgi:hypothetical protein|nr:MAG: hypothetical protein BWX84_02814 [Verrucomicrobia bacterium ADurb.Bin118]
MVILSQPMKHIFFQLALLVTCVVSAHLCVAQPHCCEVTATNGLKLEFCLHGRSSRPTATDETWYQFISPSNTPAFRVYIPQPAYLCTVELTDPNGNKVDKSWAGRKYGRQFDGASATNVPFEKNQRGTRLNSLVTPNGSGQFKLPPCNELFKIDQPGDYTLTVRIQVVREVIKGGTFAGWELVRFPPLKILLHNK